MCQHWNQFVLSQTGASIRFYRNPEALKKIPVCTRVIINQYSDQKPHKHNSRHIWACTASNQIVQITAWLWNVYGPDTCAVKFATPNPLRRALHSVLSERKYYIVQTWKPSNQFTQKRFFNKHSKVKERPQRQLTVNDAWATQECLHNGLNTDNATARLNRNIYIKKVINSKNVL